MKPTFVETSNVREFYASLKRFNERGAQEACLVVVDGQPGLGKTTTLNRWVTQTGSIYMRAQVGWDYNWFIQEMLAELSVDPKSIRGKRDRFARVLAELAERAERAAFQDKVFGVVIDECDLVSSRKEIMEGIRGISDLRFMPTILVGMGRLRDNLRRFPQIESRGPNKVAFKPANIQDTRALIDGRCEVPVADDLVQLVWQRSRGFNREILDAIAHIERFGKRADIDEGGVTVADMAGQGRRTDMPSRTGQSLSIDLGNTVTPRFLIGSESVIISDRRVTGTAVVEATSLATIDWFARALERTRGALSIVHGKTAGNIVEITAPAVEIGKVTQGQTDGILNYSLPLSFVPVTGRDEISVIVR